MSLLYFFFFIFGLIIGSFINALVYRLHEDKSLWERSLCPQCGKTLAWFHNVPLVSFVFLGGRCAFCKQAISFQYPLIELISGVLFFLSGFFFLQGDGDWPYVIWLCFFLSVTLALILFDLRYMEVPTVLVNIGIGGTFLWLLFLSVGSSGLWYTSPLLLGLAGGSVISFLFFLLVYFSHETWMGWGDVGLGFLAGLAVGISQALFLLTLSFTLGALVGLLLILLKKKGMASAVPFAPFLLTATVLLLFFSRIFPVLLAPFFL